MKKRYFRQGIALISALAMAFSCVGASAQTMETNRETGQDSQPSAGIAYEPLSSLPQNIQSLLPEAKAGDVIVPSANAYELTVKHADGTYTTEVYAAPVKYEDESGETKYVDTSMQAPSLWSRLVFNPTYRSDNGYVSLAYASKAAKGVGVDDAFTLSIPQRDGQEAAESTTAEDGSGKIIYPNAFGENTYVEYINTHAGFKENIVLEKNIGKNTFDFEWKSETHVPVLTADKQAIRIVSKADPEQEDYTISPLYVYDSFDPTTSENPYSHKHWTDDCRYEVIEQEEGTYILRAVVSEEYLNHPETVYPVTIDPSVNANAAASNVDDAHVKQSSPNERFGKLDHLQFGYLGGKMYSFIMFNQLPNLPANTIYTSAHMKVTYRTGQNTPAQMKVSINGCNDRFTLREGEVTWNTRPYGKAVQASVLPKITNGYLDSLDWNISSLVRSWYTYDYNNGIVFHYANETYNDYNSVVSSEGDAARSPKLTINYMVPASTQTAGITNNTYYYIRNKATGKYLDISGSTTDINQWGFNATPNQLWKISYEGSGCYSLTCPRYPNKRLTSLDTVFPSQTSVLDSNGEMSQRFYFIPDGNGYFRIAPRIQNFHALEVENASTASGAIVQANAYSGADHQRWALEKYTLSVTAPKSQIVVGETMQIGKNSTALAITWSSSDKNVATVSSDGKVTAKLAGVTTITAKCTEKPSISSTCEIRVNQTLTGADTYITDPDIRDTIINAKNMCDIAHNMYLSGTISYSQEQDIKKSAEYAADLARADFVVVNDKSNFVYQYFKGRNYKNGDLYPFTRELVYNESNPMKGLDVMIVQRGMQAIGIFEPDEDYNFGTYDYETYTAAAAYPNLLLNKKFDTESYLGIFSISTSSMRTPQWLLNLQEYSRQHKQVQLAVAARAQASIEVGIENGGPSGNHYGRADVLRDRGTHSVIWEIKHEHPDNLQKGNSQLGRYISAADNNIQSFSTPLRRGYDFSTFYIPYSSTTCLEIKSTTVEGLVFYKEIPVPTPTPSYAEVPFPEAQKEYEYQLKPIPLKAMVAAGVSIAFIAGELYIWFQSGGAIPFDEGLRNLEKVLRYAYA